MGDIARTFDAEPAVIGCMLAEPDILPELLAKADARDFTSEPGRLTFEAARSLFREGKAVDVFAIRNLIGANYSEYLAQCLEITATTANWREHLQAMHEQAALSRIQAEALNLSGAQTIAQCRESIERLSAEFGAGRRVESWTLAELLSDFAQRAGGSEKPDYITYGVEPLDDGTFTIKGDVVMIGGSPSDGKTAFALCCAAHMAKTHNVGFFSLETGKEKLEDRLVASGFQIDLAAIKRRTMTETDWNRFASGLADASKLRLRVFRASGMTAEQIAATARAYQLDVVFIDYVQLVEPDTARRENRATQMSEVSRALHTFAQTSGTLVVELAQLTRQEPQQPKYTKKDEPPPPDKERTMYDLAESSQFEKDADLILLLFRPGKNTHLVENDPDSMLLDEKIHRVLRVAKNKEYVWGRWPLAFDGPHQSFSVLRDERETMRAYAAAGRAAKDRNHAEAMRQQTLEELPRSEEEGMPF